MLNPAQAREQLGKLASTRHPEARLARVKKLPTAARTPAYSLLGLGADGRPIADYAVRNRMPQVAAARLHDSPKLRRQVLAALFPTIADDVEAGWRVFGRLPYTQGYARRAFRRAPDRPALSAARRGQFLNGLAGAVLPYPDDTLSATWLAAWAVHLDPTAYSGYVHNLGYLLAGVLDRKDATAAEVFDILKDSAGGQHAVGGSGGHIARAMLCSARPDAWEFMEKMLLAAQRQEGLRQTILEAVDEAHPKAFPRFVELVLRENLARFSSVARATGVWLGEEVSALTPKKLKDDLTQLHGHLADPASARTSASDRDPLTTYRGLWALALVDVEEAVTTAKPILKDKDAQRRYAAVRLLAQTSLPEVGDLLLPMLDDADLGVVALTLQYFTTPGTIYDDDEAAGGRPKSLFEKLEKLIPKLPSKPTEIKPVIEGWERHVVSSENAADLLGHCLDKRPPERLIPYLDRMGSWTQIVVIGLLTEKRTITRQVQDLLLAIAGHPMGAVRGAALRALAKCKLAEDEAQTLEGYLTRKTADFRQGVLGLLLGRADKPVLGSITRLLAAKDANQRGAGIELARQMVAGKRQPDAARGLLVAFRDAKAGRLAKPEADAIGQVLDQPAAPASLDDGLGLMNPADRTSGTPPRRKKVKLATPAALALVKNLDAFLDANKEATYTVENWQGQKNDVVIGSANHWAFPRPDADKSADEDRARLPLADLWEAWFTSLPKACKDADGLEIVRAIGLELMTVRDGEQRPSEWDDEVDDDDFGDEAKDVSRASARAARELRSPPARVRYDLVGMLLMWMRKMHPAPGTADFLLDATEHSLAVVPPAVLAHVPKEHDWRDRDWRQGSTFVRWLGLARQYRDGNGASWTTAHDVRLYGLLRWMDQPVSAAKRMRPLWTEMLAAQATPADFVDHAIGPRGLSVQYGDERFDLLQAITPADGELPESVAARPDLRELSQRIRERLLEVELTRGETPTAATPAAKAIAGVHGAATLFRLLKALGKQPFAKTTYGVADSKPAILTHLVRVSHPAADDTPEAFAAMVKEATDVPAERVMELALLNPRWVRFVEVSLKWPGFSEAVWWFIAHTENAWSRETDEEAKKPGSWASILKARTNLSAEQRADGVIDVAWFHQAYGLVGNAKRWDAIEEAAKFLGYGAGHKKAARLADVLLGKTKKKELVEGIRKKNLKEYVRLLGLLPLPADAAKREAELLDRHRVLREYERYARSLSALSKEPAMAAARLGLENLAVTAGYGDPLRLEWAVGTKEVADLLKGPVRLDIKGVGISLALTGEAVPEVTQARDGKPLKSIPPDVKKLPKVADLMDRVKDLKRLSAATKRSLEQAMCAGDAFSAAELRMLMGHALVRPLLSRLVLQAGDVRGYPTDDGSSLRDHAGKSVRVKADATWIVAHPLDLLAAGDWHDWQAECFRAERVQPFKQVFREVYTLTAVEKDDTRSTRFAGQQVNPKQSTALFGSRGWSTREGTDKLFRRDNLLASVDFDHGYTTPAEVEGPTFSAVEFRRRGDWKQVPLKDVPGKVFSEVLRDLDLVVSVAHVGGIDPEASQSTVEMRATLVTETCALLKLDNVRPDGKHVFIKGSLGSYSVHLGSGSVHKQPGGSLCVVPVHSQHRGRLFLPFADDDPRTAEVVSKVLLLARDGEIQDPTILSQIAGR